MNGRIYNVGGTLVHEDVLRVVQEIERRYGDQVVVQYLNPDSRQPVEITDAPYRILEKRRDGGYSVICKVWELDNRVLQALEAADNLFREVSLIEEIEKAERKEREDRQKAERDWSENFAQPVLQSYLKADKTRYTYTDEETGEKVVIKEDGTTERS